MNINYVFSYITSLLPFVTSRVESQPINNFIEENEEYEEYEEYKIKFDNKNINDKYYLQQSNTEYLWTNKKIKCDLDWIVNNFDLCEEILEQDFIKNRIIMQKKLIYGYNFSIDMNDNESAYKYYKTMKEINETLYGINYDNAFIDKLFNIKLNNKCDNYNYLETKITINYYNYEYTSSVCNFNIGFNKIQPIHPIKLWSGLINSKILQANQTDGVLLSLRYHIDANKFRKYKQINTSNNLKLYVNHLNKII